MNTFVPNDVLISIPKPLPSSEVPAYFSLWFSSKILKTHSEYFKTMLDSDFSESLGIQDASTSIAQNDYDSDEERDVIYASRLEKADKYKHLYRNTEAKLYHVQVKSAYFFSFLKVVLITPRSTRYTTYRATLHWLLTGTISFAHLQSLEIDMNEETRSAELLPCSPKSVYHLAHVSKRL